VNGPKTFPPHRIPAVDGAKKCALWPRILSLRISGVRGQLNLVISFLNVNEGVGLWIPSFFLCFFDYSAL